MNMPNWDGLQQITLPQMMNRCVARLTRWNVNPLQPILPSVVMSKWTVVDILVYDNSSMFGQLDESKLELPTACNTSGNGSNVCHFHYLLN
jgi:hypothetical protein